MKISIKEKYRKRPVRFLELFEYGEWKIKIYSISVRKEFVDKEIIKQAKEKLPGWLLQNNHSDLPTYRIATLILHEGKEGCFAIINWWTDENMLQLFVYLSAYNNPGEFLFYSGNGIITCVWEMAVLWYERNAWVEHVLMKPARPDIKAYLDAQLNAGV